MGTIDNRLKAATTTPLTQEQRLAQAREYAKQFAFDTLSEEDLKKMRRNAYAYAI